MSFPSGRWLLATFLAFSLAPVGACTNDTTPTYNPKAPTASIIEPSDAAGIPEFNTGETIQFVGTAEDDKTPVEELTVAWTVTYTSDSGEQVSIEVGGSEVDSAGRTSINVSSLDPRTYTMRMGVTDADELTAYDYSDFSVLAPDLPPEVFIVDPGDGAEFAEGEEVDFIGSAEDDRGPENLSVSWNSDIDGALSADSPGADGLMAFALTDLSPGTHTISVTVEDEGGQEATDSISLVIIPQNQPPTPMTIP